MFFKSLWDRIPDNWLVNRAATIVFAASALLAVTVFPAVSHIDYSYVGAHPLANALVGLYGVLGALSLFCIWSGMWRYWVRCDRSGPGARRLWFCVLLIGLWYGAAVYFVAVYLPQVLRRAGPQPTDERVATDSAAGKPAAVESPTIRVFRRAVIAGWIILWLAVALLLTLREAFARFFNVYVWTIYAFILLIFTLVYRIARVYSSGMRRSTSAPR